MGPSRLSTVTGVVSEPSLQDLKQLASMNSADITRYIERHPMVADTILTILRGVSGTASMSCMVSYRQTLDNAADIDKERKPLEDACKGILSSVCTLSGLSG